MELSCLTLREEVYLPPKNDCGGIIKKCGIIKRFIRF